MVGGRYMRHVSPRFLQLSYVHARLTHSHKPKRNVVALINLGDFMVARVFHSINLVPSQELDKQAVQILRPRPDNYLLRRNIHASERFQMADNRTPKLAYTAPG